MPASFVHLHTHSAYSLAEGAIPVKKLKSLCEAAQMPALAVTDANNLFGALEVAETFSPAGIQPIVGIELAVGGDKPTDPRERAPAPSKLVLLAQNETGYMRLMDLASKSFLSPAQEGEPCVALDEVCQSTDGIICLSGGLDGPVDRALSKGDARRAAKLVATLAAAFPDRFYVELVRSPASDDTDRAGRFPHEAKLVELAFAQDLPLVATNNVYFPKAQDHAAHDALLCIAEGSYISQDDRRRVPEDFWFKSEDDMLALFEDLPEACASTIEIAQRCAFRPRTHPPILPSFAGDLEGEFAALEKMAREGLDARLEAIEPAASREEYDKRLDHELNVIKGMGFPGYFLIVADFIQWAKAEDIPVGPGRGSGAGSLVAYALTITDLDPLRFNLLFERFLNPERISMPDFDIDFCQDRRDEVIRYVQRKYGHDRVAQIITFGKLQARAVLRDVGRVLQMPFGQVDRLCKMVPNNPANPTTLAEAVAGEPRFEDEKREDPQVGVLIETALKLEGLYRHASTHAAGVVIGDRPLHEIVPLYLDPRADMPATQFNMKWVEPAGLVKFDFLGLKTLTVIRRALDNLKAEDIDLDIDKIDVGDEDTFAMLTRGEATGVFQLESSGMRSALKGMKPDSLEDIIALVSLYRPGPMDNIPTYNARKAGEEEPDYLHPLLEDILRETFGVIIYQEQVMQIAQVLSGYSLGEADLLRRAMGKKKKEEMDKQKVRFVAGAKENNVSAAKAESIFNLVAKFAGYGFNKSHAAAYAWIAYQTAFLKAHHPAAFLAASMSLDLANTDKLATFHGEAKRSGVKVHPPCVNHSQADFFSKEGEVFYALGAVKNVGFEAMRHIASVRAEGGPFKDLFDFAERIDGRQVGKRGMEQLARAGAFDGIHPNRAQVFAAADTLVRYSAACADERTSDNLSLLTLDEAVKTEPPRLPGAAEWSLMEQLEEERQAIGFYLSGHPLSAFREELEQNRVQPSAPLLAEEEVGTRTVLLAGVIREVTNRRSKSGKPFAWVTLSDESGEFEVTLFSETLQKHQALLEPGTPILLSATADDHSGSLRLTGEGIRKLEKGLGTKKRGPVPLAITVAEVDAFAEIKQSLKGCASSQEDAPPRLVLPIPEEGCEVVIHLPEAFKAGTASKGPLQLIQGVGAVEETA
ncbi:DNA polymerase III subunit alpha [Parvularcula sp. ZS-1/3]|uniref:DNA polymerase III subunit alpha n=1 Tax=Parvularcula mediterranea TaxID=2732508 RepID=A0A7Y3W579_9PROT|nr:DNA polymerase III subunit alpha [Parvularcula mediterranea]NNU16344.1 DNA polymerase III subunit alpha [Parvularcula mediterranea]